MTLGDRLGIAGLVVALIGISTVYLFPEKKWIGWFSLILAGCLLLGWGVMEVTPALGSGRASLITSVIAGALIGAGLAAIIWFSVSSPTKPETSSIPRAQEGHEQHKEAEPEHEVKPLTLTAIPQRENASPIERLSQLGWTVKPGKGDLQFELANSPLPNMEESARCFRELQKQFRIYLQGTKAISALASISGIGSCKQVVIGAGEFTDVSDLAGFTHLTSLLISQTPINGLSVLDLAPILTLEPLRN